MNENTSIQLRKNNSLLNQTENKFVIIFILIFIFDFFTIYIHMYQILFKLNGVFLQRTLEHHYYIIGFTES